jgi:hypothetical protein
VSRSSLQTATGSQDGELAVEPNTVSVIAGKPLDTGSQDGELGNDHRVVNASRLYCTYCWPAKAKKHIPAITWNQGMSFPPRTRGEFSNKKPESLYCEGQRYQQTETGSYQVPARSSSASHTDSV